MLGIANALPIVPTATQAAGGFACFGKKECTPPSGSARASRATSRTARVTSSARASTLQTAKTAREDARTARADAFKTLREQKKAARTELLQELTANVERIYKERVAKELASLRRSDPNMEDSERLKVAKMLAEAEAYRMKVVGADQIIVKVDEMFGTATAPRAGGRLRKPKVASKPKAAAKSKPKSKKKLSTK